VHHYNTTSVKLKQIFGLNPNVFFLGKRKGLTVLGYGLSTAVKPLMYIASTWGMVLGVRFTDRLGKGVRTAPRDALVADSVTPEQRGKAFGLHRAMDTFGAVVALFRQQSLFFCGRWSTQRLRSSSVPLWLSWR
jgi:hypothetical protein